MRYSIWPFEKDGSKKQVYSKRQVYRFKKVIKFNSRKSTSSPIDDIQFLPWTIQSIIGCGSGLSLERKESQFPDLKLVSYYLFPLCGSYQVGNNL